MPVACVAACTALVVGFLSGPFSGLAAEVTCDSLLPQTGDTGYQKRSGDTRCEGVYQSPVGADGLDLISIAYDPGAVDLAINSVLLVSVPNNIGTTVHLRAVAAPLQKYYRMDANVKPGETLKWPGDILRSLDLSFSQIGVVGWIEVEGKRKFVPLRITTENPGLNPQSSEVHLRFRSQVSLERAVWRTVADGKPPSPWNALKPGPVSAGEAIDLVLPDLPQGGKLDIRGKPPNSDVWSVLSVDVWRNSQ